MREARRLLDQRGKILTLELNGAIFFGSSVTTLEHIKTLLGIPPSSPRPAALTLTKGASYRPSRTHSRRVPAEGTDPTPSSSSSSSSALATPVKTFRSAKRVLDIVWARLQRRRSIYEDMDEEEEEVVDDEETALTGGGTRSSTQSSSSSSRRPVQAARVGAALAAATSGSSTASSTASSAAADYGAIPKPTHTRQESAATAHRPRFLILDFRRVSAIDMSSVVNCFLPLQTLCKDLKVVLCYSNCNVRVEFYLRANRLLEDTNTRLFPTLHQALDSCETALLAEEAVHTHGHSVRARAFSLRGVQELSVVSVLRTMLLEEEDEGEEEGRDAETAAATAAATPPPHALDEAALETIAHYAREERYKECETIFYKDDPSDSFYLILSGEVALESTDEEEEKELLLDVHPRGVERPTHRDDEGDGRHRHTEVVLHSGALFGFVDFFLENQRRRFFARALTSVKLGVFSQTALRRLEGDNPRLMVLVQKLLLKQFSIELGNVSAL